MAHKTIAIDSDGYFKLQDGRRFDDEATGRAWLKNLKIDEFGVCSFDHDEETIIAEPFDKPYVAQQVLLDDGLKILLPYDLQLTIRRETFCVDAWDRFHGLSENGIPFVLTRKAQAELFNLADEFSDDSITIAGQLIETPNFYIENSQAGEESFWTGVYQENPSPPWNLDEPHPFLETAMAQLKPLKGRVGVLGCGYGHDAHFFSDKGHIVTGYDVSPTAVERAKEKYQADNLEFQEADVFKLPESHSQSFDYLFEHTLYCAIPPSQRRQLIKTWWQLLSEEGHLLGVFFVNPKRSGPPYGSSEWELQQELEPYFDFLYWTRLKNSPGWRQGIELAVYAKKRSEPKR